MDSDQPDESNAVLQWSAEHGMPLEWAVPGPDGYIRRLDDRGWQARMRAMRKLVMSAKDAVDPILGALDHREPVVPILAAQTLGYLAPHVPRQPLFMALESDRDAAVPLYAVASLGMQGG